MQNLFVAQLISPMPEGTQVRLGDWPPHLTLAGSFITDLSREAALNGLGRVAAQHRQLDALAVAKDMFGPAHDIAVTLLEPSVELLDLHFDLGDFVSRVGHFEDASYTGFGYRPHVTDQPGFKLEVGTRLRIDALSVFDFDAATNKRTLLKTWPLSSF